MPKTVKYKTAEELEAKVNEYFRNCDLKDTMPDEAGMRLFLGINKIMQAEYETGEGQYKGFDAVLEYAADRRESWLCRKMSSDHKAAAGCMNLLKQSANGGYVDRQKDNAKEQTLKIVIDGDPELFK